jgi:ankyrin repeat protein
VQLLRHRCALSTISNDGDTLLHYAAQSRTPATVRLILDVGLDIEAKNNIGQTALHCATRWAEFEGSRVVKALLESGADIHAIDNEGRTPLQVLLDSNPTNYVAPTILHHQTISDSGLCKGSQACVWIRRFAERDEPVVDQSLCAGANIGASSNSTCSPLQWAASLIKR